MSFEKEKEQFPEKSITLAEYFATTYNKQVNKDLQCVELRGGQFVPIECLELLQGAAIPPTRLSASQASAMINVAAKPPAERVAAIQQIRQQSDFGPQSAAAQWGLEVEKDMLRLTGRVLPPPKVLYNQKSKTAAPNVRFGCVPSASGPEIVCAGSPHLARQLADVLPVESSTRSAWNLIESKFLVPAIPLTRWSVAVFARQQDAPPPAVIAFFQQQLLKQAALRGACSLPSLIDRHCLPFAKLWIEMWSRLARPRTGMDIRAPRSGIKITYWNGQEDKIEPLKRAANDVVINNVS